MKERTRKIFIMIVMAALIVSLMAASFAALTYGRYTGGRRDENSAYEDILDLVGETAFEVSTADELVNAINNGYSYIKISGDAEEPFVVNNNVADVYTNLVLDVNGHKIVRNSRNPLLDVKRSVSVVLVYDSSTEQAGGFYNPVGSALQTSGGSLTVGSGGYESGPRAGEYQGKEAAGELGSDTNVTLFARSNEENNAVTGPNNLTGSNNLTRADYVSGYSPVSGVSLPTIEPTTTQDSEGNVETVRGNVYLSSDHSAWLPADTFLVYTVEENCFIGDDTSSGNVTFVKDQLYVNAEREGDVISASEFISPECNVASCDFYYYYPIGDDDNDGYKDYAVIYGYWDVMKLARDEKKTDENGTEYGMASALQDDGLVWPYAAIRSEDGNTHARGGEFKTHFGVENTYCIYSAGGTMTVGGTAEPKFSAVQSGVCIRMREGGETEEQRSAPSLTIDSGEFSSEIGDTIKMSGGEMEVKKGTFTKNAKDADEDSTNNGSAISISGGKLNVKGASTVQFNIKGSYVNGIRTEKETTGEVEDDEITNAAFNFNTGAGESGSSNIGISANGGTTIATNCTFTMHICPRRHDDGNGQRVYVYGQSQLWRPCRER